MKVTKRSPLTGEENTLELEVTQEQLDRYAAGTELIQNVFPHLTAAEREFLMSGYTQADWDQMFPPEES